LLLKTPVNGQTLSQHFRYSWWKYLLLVLVSFGLVDLLYTVTAYRSPPEKVVQFYIYGLADTTGLNEYMESVRQSEMPDMEVMNASTLVEDDTYGNMQLTTYLAAGEGDLYLLPRDNFIGLAASSAFLTLEQDEELMTLFDEAGVSLQSGWRRDPETGENHLYGIPFSKLPGLARYAYAKDGFLCVLVTNGNDDNVLKFLRILCRDMLAAPEEETSSGSEQP